MKGKNNNQQKGNHHFIPQVYIQRFYDEEKKLYGEVKYSIKKLSTSHLLKSFMFINYMI